MNGEHQRDSPTSHRGRGRRCTPEPMLDVVPSCEFLNGIIELHEESICASHPRFVCAQLRPLPQLPAALPLLPPLLAPPQPPLPPPVDLLVCAVSRIVAHSGALLVDCTSDLPVRCGVPSCALSRRHPQLTICCRWCV